MWKLPGGRHQAFIQFQLVCAVAAAAAFLFFFIVLLKQLSKMFTTSRVCLHFHIIVDIAIDTHTIFFCCSFVHPLFSLSLFMCVPCVFFSSLSHFRSFFNSRHIYDRCLLSLVRFFIQTRQC